MMSVTIAITPYTPSAPATFDAGRQPLASLQFNTPEQKRSVKVRKHTDVFKDVPEPKNSVEVPNRIADVFSSPQAVSPSTDIAYTLNEVNVEEFDDDDDIPIARLKEIALSSLATGPSTLRRVSRVTKRAGPMDSEDPDDEDLPLCRVKELMEKLGRRPARLQSVPGGPPPFKHTLLRPATIPMKCIVAECPFDWHDHVNAGSH